MTNPLGRGEWDAYIAARGGTPLKLEVGYTSIRREQVLNGTGNARINIPEVADFGCDKREVVKKSEPWRDEVVLYRDRQLVYAGPLIRVGGRQSPNCASQGLFHWFTRRFIENDLHFEADVSDIFAGIFAAAMEADTSPNIDLSTRPTGVRAVRDYAGAQLHPAQGLMTELAKTGLDFTEIGRKVLAGGVEVFLDDDPLVLHDDGVLEAEPEKDGSSFANDVAILGATIRANETPQNGRATLGQSVYGLVQRVFTELLIQDEDSADANALARAQAMQPIPQRLNVTFSPEAGFTYEDLIPGRKMDCRLRDAGVERIMRIVRVTTDVNVSSGVTETVSADLVPLGVEE